MKDLKELFIVLGLIIGIPLVVYGVTEANWQSNVAKMKQSLSNARKEILDPTKGVEESAPTVTHGESFLTAGFALIQTVPKLRVSGKF